MPLKKEIENLATVENNTDLANDIKDFEQREPKINALKDEISKSKFPTIICESKPHNKNYLTIIFANDKFYQQFSISESSTIGKSYDFLFSDIDIDYCSQNHLEYAHLLKSVKSLEACSVDIEILVNKESSIKKNFTISFLPDKYSKDEAHNLAIFTFRKSENNQSTESTKNIRDRKASTSNLLANLERSLRKERLLRETGSLIIADLPITEIANGIAKILCLYLKSDRCLVHDYQNSQTSFVAEYASDEKKKIITDILNQEVLKEVAKYINFQNHFFTKFGNLLGGSFLFAIDDISKDSNFDKERNVYEKFRIASQISATTIFNNKINGGIYIHQSNSRIWTADEIELIEMVANQFAIAIDRSQSIEKVMVTNHALMEKTLELKEALRYEKELRQMQSEFVAMVSHEFKTPLQIIDSTREVIVRKIKKLEIVDDVLDKSFSRIKMAIQRMNGLIHSTLNLAKMENDGDNKIKVQREIFDLKKFLLDIIDKNSELAVNKNITLIVKIDELPTEFSGDPKLLDHAFTNIISNAIKYSKNNTIVKILAKANDKKVLIRAIDQGIGIPKEDIKNIGQKFFRAKNTLEVAGTGIGIYLTKHFIELHQGKIMIESEINVGTSVTVSLPKV